MTNESKGFPLRMLNGWVAVRRTERTGLQTRASGVMIPNSADDQKATQAVVLAVQNRFTGQTGKHSQRTYSMVDTGLAPGDRVLLGRYAGTGHMVNGEEITLLKCEDVLAVVSRSSASAAAAEAA